MNKLMLKDFIRYNSPCVNCNSSINVTVHVSETGYNMESTSKLNCIVTSEYSEIDLKISYNDSLRLKIFHKTNIFESNDMQKLFFYLSKHKIFFSSQCPTCRSYVQSTEFGLDINTFRAKPLFLYREDVRLVNGNIVYTINTNHFKNSSQVSVMDKGALVFGITMNAIPLDKLRDKQRFFDKIKTYILFS